MTKLIIGVVLLVVMVLGGSFLMVSWAFNTDMRNAEERCAALGAEPRYTYQTRYLCVTPDGRIVE